MRFIRLMHAFISFTYKTMFLKNCDGVNYGLKGEQ
jgi:hypothetical protein